MLELVDEGRGKSVYLMARVPLAAIILSAAPKKIEPPGESNSGVTKRTVVIHCSELQELNNRAAGLMCSPQAAMDRESDG